MNIRETVIASNGNSEALIVDMGYSLRKEREPNWFLLVWPCHEAEAGSKLTAPLPRCTAVHINLHSDVCCATESSALCIVWTIVVVVFRGARGRGI